MGGRSILAIYSLLFSFITVIILIVSDMGPHNQDAIMPMFVDFAKVSFGALLGQIGAMAISGGTK